MRKADNLSPSCAVVTKSGNLNFLEPSGPVTGLLYLFTFVCGGSNRVTQEHRSGKYTSSERLCSSVDLCDLCLR